MIVELKSVERSDPVFEAQVVDPFKIYRQAGWFVDQLHLPPCERRDHEVYFVEKRPAVA